MLVKSRGLFVLDPPQENVAHLCSYSLLLLLLALLTLLALLSLFALLALFVGIEQRFGHVGLRGHLADGQRDWLLGCAQLDLNGVPLVLRLGLAAQLDKEHIAIGLLARFVTDLERERERREKRNSLKLMWRFTTASE